MSTEVLARKNEKLLAQIYEAEWEIKKVSGLKNKVIRTAAFSPFIDNKVQFCLEIRYESIHVSTTSNQSYTIIKSYATCLKFLLIKLSSVNVPTTLEMKINMKVNYSDGTLLKEYLSLIPILVHNMTSVTCVEEVFQLKYHNQSEDIYFSEPRSYDKLRTDNLTIECQFMYFDYLNTPSSHLLSLNNLKILSKNLSSIYNLGISCDVTIQVGDKSLQAHKAVLIAHSPVIRKMMEHDFIESKTNTITITDSDYDTFDCFLKFLYSGEVEDKTLDTVRQLYILADKYEIQALKRECAVILVSTLTVDQVCEVLKCLYDYEDDLKEVAKYFATVHFSDLVTRSEWTELVKSHPQICYDVLLARK